MTRNLEFNRRIDWLITEMDISGGAEMFVRQITPRLKQAGWDLHVISLRSGGALLSELEQEGIRVMSLGLQNQVALPITLARLYFLWRKNPPMLIHTHLYHAGVIGRVVGRLAGVKTIVVHQHGAERSRSRLRSLLDRRTSGWATQYIATCQAVAYILQQREAVPENRISVIYNGVEETSKKLVSCPPEWPVPQEVPVIACVGRLVMEKGQRWLIEALAILRQKGKIVHLVLIGEGDQRQALEEQAQQRGLAEQVHFLGNRRDVRNWLPFFSVYVQPSDWEGVSLALLEALAAGLPVVATAVGGTPEVIENGVSGFLVRPGDPRALAAATERFLEDPVLGFEMALRGQKRVRCEFSLEKTTLEIDALYKRLLPHSIE